MCVCVCVCVCVCIYDVLVPVIITSSSSRHTDTRDFLWLFSHHSSLSVIALVGSSKGYPGSI